MTKKVKGCRLLEEDGRVWVRFYTDHGHIDYDMDILELGVFMKDVAAIHCYAVARALNKEIAA